ncbi:helix-turn-helix domain-containing protein, partial [Escherichia sp. HC-CC]
MYEQGIGYPDIAQQLNCHVTTLRKELKKRGLWKGLSAEQLRVQRVKNRSSLGRIVLQLAYTNHPIVV